MVELVLKIPAIEKLLDYLVSGIGATAGPLLLPWRAHMEGKADRISARYYADALPIIAQAQADARQYLVAPDADVQGRVEITHEHIEQLIEFQGLKRLANIASVVENAAEELSDQEVPDREPDHDWTTRFFDCVQDVSSEHMQKLWAKVLSGEVESPGRTSLRALDTLRNMTKRDAKLFEGTAGFVIGGDFIYYDFVEGRHNAIGFDVLLHLQNCGLINAGPLLERTLSWKDEEELFLPYLAGALRITKGQNSLEEFGIPGALLTTAGKELFCVVQGTEQMAYLQNFSSFLHMKGIQLSFVQGVESLLDGSTRYANRTPIKPKPIQPGMPVR